MVLSDILRDGQVIELVSLIDSELTVYRSVLDSGSDCMVLVITLCWILVNVYAPNDGEEVEMMRFELEEVVRAAKISRATPAN